MRYRLRILTGRSAVIGGAGCLASLLWNTCSGRDDYVVEQFNGSVWVTLIEFNGSTWSAAFIECVRSAAFNAVSDYAACVA